MELEHAFQQSAQFTAFQLMFVSAFFMPGMLGRIDVVRSFVRTVVSYVLSLGPVAMLIYILYEVSHWR